MKSISNAAVLVNLSISTWSARLLDRDVTEEVNISKHASQNASRVNKNLFPDVQALTNIARHAAASRNWLDKAENTLPWSDYGPRLLPMTRYFDLKPELDKRQREFYQLVDIFINEYPLLISAQAFKLGEMFNRDEYPTAEDVRAKFRFNAVYTPLPEAGDFRVDIEQEALADLQQEYQREYEARLEAMVKTVQEEVFEHIRHLMGRLESTEEGKPVRIRGPIVEKFVDTMTRIRAFNLTKDETLDKLTVAAERMVDGVSTDELRTNDAIRRDIKARAGDLLDAFTF